VNMTEIGGLQWMWRCSDIYAPSGPRKCLTRASQSDILWIPTSKVHTEVNSRTAMGCPCVKIGESVKASDQGICVSEDCSNGICLCQIPCFSSQTENFIM